MIERNELRVGIFILIPTIIILLFTTLKLGYSIASSTIDVYLKIDSLTSVKKGTRVKIKGYTIGKVVELKPVYKPALHFLATMRIERDIQIYESCSAIILNQNVIGDPAIELKNPEKKGAVLQHRDVIEGIEYVNLEAILQDVHVLLSTLSSTVGIFKDITLDSKNNLRVLVGDLSISVRKLKEILDDSQKDIVTLLSSFRQTAEVLNEISKEFKKNPMKFMFEGKK